MFPNFKNPKKPIKYFCEKCDFYTYNKKDFTRHLTTDKHKILTNPNEKPQKTPYDCTCGKSYKHSSSLSAHKRKCNINNGSVNTLNNTLINSENNFHDKDELINYLIKENQEFKNLILETLKNGTMNNSYNTTNYTNSHNKSFNLQFFLNETCKDAMNIMDFVDSIKLQLSDLERIGEIGYVEGISNIIVKNLNALDVTQRPVHCTDKKREVLYVKDENKWEKEDENKAKMHKVVRKVADKNVKLLPKFKEEYPDCSKSTSKYSDQYNKIIVESMGGSGDNDYEKEEKIIKRITKEVFIDKEPS
jgi:hypothetical protein